LDSGVYQILNTCNNNKYIGSSTRIRKRWIEHESRLKSNKHENPHLQNSWNKYGGDSFEFSVIARTPPNYTLKLEQWFLDNTITWDKDYNISKLAGKPKNHNTVVYKFDEEGNEIFRYVSIKEACLNEGLGRASLKKNNNFRLIPSRTLGVNPKAKKLGVYNKEGVLIKSYSSIKSSIINEGLDKATIDKYSNTNTLFRGMQMYTCKYDELLPNYIGKYIKEIKRTRSIIATKDDQIINFDSIKSFSDKISSNSGNVHRALRKGSRVKGWTVKYN